MSHNANVNDTFPMCVRNSVRDLEHAADSVYQALFSAHWDKLKEPGLEAKEQERERTGLIQDREH